MTLLPSCVDEYRPEVEGYDRLLVVDGGITNQPGPYEVRLVRSIGVYGYEYQEEDVTGALVVIQEEGGVNGVLTEIAPGRYSTIGSDLRGEPGRRYRIVIRTAENTQYESDWERLRAPTAIDTVRHQLEYHYIPELEQDIPGYQFYATTGAPEQPENHYLYLLEATYKYRADFPLRRTYQGYFRDVPDPDTLRTCWRSYTVEQVFAFSTTGYASQQLRSLPLHFVRADRKELSIRYSLLTRQLSLGPEAYAFWKAIADQVSNTESLYNRQPFQVRGNVYNVDQPDEAVLGYFLVAGEANTRLFVDKPHVEVDVLRCDVDTIGLQDISYTRPPDWPVYITFDEGHWGLGPYTCIDCRELGGVLERPAFWED